MNAITASGGMRRSEQLNELASALAQSQGMFTSAEREHVAKVMSKKGEGSSYSYNYADLASYLEVCRKPLADCGLSFVQSTEQDSGRVSVATMLLHKSGQWIEFPPLTLHAENALPQTIGSAITYARRYSLSAALGMASEADDDGNAANGNQASTGNREPRKSLPSCPSCGKADSIIQGKSEYGAGLLCYKAKGGCGHSWETSEHPFNENHKGKKKSPPADDGAKPGTGKVDFTEAMRSLDGATPAKRKVWRERILARYGNGDIDLDDMANLAVEAAKRFEDDAEAQLIHKWLCDICNLGNESRFDAAANELSKQRAELAMA